MEEGHPAIGDSRIPHIGMSNDKELLTSVVDCSGQNKNGTSQPFSLSLVVVVVVFFLFFCSFVFFFVCLFCFVLLCFCLCGGVGCVWGCVF